MFKKMMSVLLIVAFVAVLPLMGCKKNEVNIHRDKTETHKETHMVVE